VRFRGKFFKGELDSGEKLNVHATKRTDLGTNFSSILGKKNAPKFGAFFTFISRILYECLAYFALAFFMTLAALSVALFARVLARLRSNLIHFIQLQKKQKSDWHATQQLRGFRSIFRGN